MNSAVPCLGYRGYIASRPINGERTAQHVQNLVIRDYAGRNRLAFRLSAVEYAMPHCYMMLEQLLEALADVDGLILFSINMLPLRPERRERVYARILEAGRELHAAHENIAIRTAEDARRLEDLFAVRALLPSCPTSLDPEPR